MQEFNAANDPTMRKYGLVCKIQTVRAYGQQGVKSGQTEFEAVILIPTQSDATTRFFSAWLPDSSEDRSEIVFELGFPVYGSCRGAVLRQSRFHNAPHIFIMSVGVEEILKHKNNEKIEITVLPATDDAIGDQAPDTEADIKVL